MRGNWTKHVLFCPVFYPAQFFPFGRGTKNCALRDKITVLPNFRKQTNLTANPAVDTFSSFSGSTDIFITPGYEFKVIDGLLTNFHLPKSTLIMMVAAFLGYDNTMAAYEEAVKEQYRFFSFGDAMLIL